MIETLAINNLILSRIELIVYLLLALIAGWALRGSLKRHWWHRPWAQNPADMYPRQGHTYLEYVPELRTPNQTSAPLPANLEPVPEGTYERYTRSRDGLQATMIPQPEHLEKNTSGLSMVEGINSHIESILMGAGIKNLKDLSETPLSRLQLFLEQAGIRKAHDPTTWAHQAYMGAAGQWDELDSYQKFLRGEEK